MSWLLRLSLQIACHFHQSGKRIVFHFRSATHKLNFSLVDETKFFARHRGKNPKNIGKTPPQRQRGGEWDKKYFFVFCAKRKCRRAFVHRQRDEWMRCEGELMEWATMETLGVCLGLKRDSLLWCSWRVRKMRSSRQWRMLILENLVHEIYHYDNLFFIYTLPTCLISQITLFHSLWGLLECHFS